MTRAAVAIALLTASALHATVARADEPAGALSLHVAGSGGDLGGGALLDIGTPLGVVVLGGTLGMIALSSDDDSRSRVFMPAAASLRLVVPSGPLRFDLRARAGIWGGATNQGLAVGGFFAAGAYLAYAFARTVAIGIGVDGWLLLGHGDRTVIAPGLTLTWMPEGD